MHKLVLLFCTSENSMPSNFRLIRNIGTPPSCWLQTQPSIIMGDQNFCHYRKHSEKLITPFPGVVKEYFTGFSANYYLVWGGLGVDRRYKVLAQGAYIANKLNVLRKM